MKNPSQEEVREWFDYHTDGYLIWKKPPGTRTDFIGKRFGYTASGGYRRGDFQNQRNLFEHRLIFLLHTGYLPETIDHLDRNPQNNRIENLRPASRSQQVMNQAPRRDGSSKWRGVSYQKQGGGYQANIHANGKRHYLGWYQTAEEAARAYNRAAAELHGEFAVLNALP